MPRVVFEPPPIKWPATPRLLTVVTTLLAALFPGLGAQAKPVPPNLVIDLRLFEARSSNPDLSRLGNLSYFVNTDGRGVTANQWLATLANKLPGSLLAQLAFETIAVEPDGAQFTWTNGSRSIDVEIRIDDYHPSNIFKARMAATLLRGEQVLRTVPREVNLQLGRTSLWSGSALELSLTDYISLFEKLRSRRIHLIMAATTRLRRDEEIGQMNPERLSLPQEAIAPRFENHYGIPLKGTICVGFELDSEGKPVNPQVIRSTLPEANSSILGESLSWRFPSLPETVDERRWGRVEVKLDVP